MKIMAILYYICSVDCEVICIRCVNSYDKTKRGNHYGWHIAMLCGAYF